MIKSRYRPYEEKFILFSNFLEKMIKRLLVLFLVLFIIAQFLLTFERFRNEWLPVEKIEGSASKFYQPIDYSGRI